MSLKLDHVTFALAETPSDISTLWRRSFELQNPPKYGWCLCFTAVYSVGLLAPPTSRIGFPRDFLPFFFPPAPVPCLSA